MTVTILQVVPRLDSGGSEQATVEVTEALTRAGAKAIVATEGQLRLYAQAERSYCFRWRAKTLSLWSRTLAASKV